MTFDDNRWLPSEDSHLREPKADAEPSSLQTPPASTEPLVAAGPVLPDDLRVPWDWMDLVLFVLLYFLGLVLIGVLTGAGFAAFGISPEQLRTTASYKGLFVILSQVILSVAVLVYLAAQMRHRFAAPFWRTIGWRPLDTHGAPHASAYLKFAITGFFLSMVVQFASASVQTKTKLPIEDLFQDKRSAILLMLTAVTVAPIVEETIFRGYIYPVIARRFGIRTSIVVTGTLFGMLHAAQLWGGWAQIALLILVGIVFTYVRSQTRTVLASYLVHLGYNTFPLVIFFVATHGLKNFPAGS